MPQMNPMNWLLLFVYFNTLLFITLVKVSFLGKEISFMPESSTGSSLKEANLSLKI